MSSRLLVLSILFCAIGKIPLLGAPEDKEWRRYPSELQRFNKENWRGLCPSFERWAKADPKDKDSDEVVLVNDIKRLVDIEWAGSEKDVVKFLCTTLATYLTNVRRLGLNEKNDFLRGRKWPVRRYLPSDNPLWIVDAAFRIHPHQAITSFMPVWEMCHSASQKGGVLFFSIRHKLTTRLYTFWDSPLAARAAKSALKNPEVLESDEVGKLRDILTRHELKGIKTQAQAWQHILKKECADLTVKDVTSVRFAYSSARFLKNVLAVYRHVDLKGIEATLEAKNGAVERYVLLLSFVRAINSRIGSPSNPNTESIAELGKSIKLVNEKIADIYAQKTIPRGEMDALTLSYRSLQRIVDASKTIPGRGKGKR